MSGRKTTGSGAGGPSPLIAAYREGLGLAAITVIRDPTGIRIVALQRDDDGVLAAEEAVEARWWCARLSEAERVAAAATARLRRRLSDDGTGRRSARGSSAAQTAPSSAEPHVFETIAGAAKRLNIILYSDEDISAEAVRIIARVDEEMERLRESGELKTVNKSYRAYRLETSARGEKVVRYADWMGKYRETLVRKLAATLRYT